MFFLLPKMGLAKIKAFFWSLIDSVHSELSSNLTAVLKAEEKTITVTLLCLSSTVVSYLISMP